MAEIEDFELALVKRRLADQGMTEGEDYKIVVESCCPQKQAADLLEQRIDGPIFTISGQDYEIRGNVDTVQKIAALWDRERLKRL